MTRTLTLVVLGLVLGCNGNKDDNPDMDGDGYKKDMDCDDGNADINPDADEICDSLDNDCDEEVDEDAVDATTYYADSDQDGYGDPENSIVSCSQPTGYITDNQDCNDASALYNPLAEETDCADPEDYNCDESVGYEDADGDGWAACEECDDSEATANPDQTEVCGDGIDNNCDNLTDDSTSSDAATWYIDYDGDGFGSTSLSVTECEEPTGFVANDSDCDDLHADAYPDDPNTTEDDPADEKCDGYDNDCDGDIDENDAIDATIWYADVDTDTYGDVLVNTVACNQPSGYVDDSSDCDDTSASVNPDADEYCDSADNDCNGTVDDNALDATAWYGDADGDGYGVFTSATTACSQPSGYADNYTDCNDSNAGINPGASEFCNGINDDCDGQTDEADSVDAVPYYQDSDGDSYGNAAIYQSSCPNANPTGWVADSSDCDDTDSQTHPGAAEICNDGIDNNCSGQTTPCTGTESNADTAITGGSYSRFGDAFGTADVDGDGQLDLVVGANTANGSNEGEVYAFYGPITGTTLSSANADITLTGPYESKAGRQISAGQDINGDGLDDVLIGVQRYYVGGTASSNKNFGGAALLLGPFDPSATDLVSTADVILAGESKNDYAGVTISMVGNVVGDPSIDNLPDILIGSDGNDSNGMTRNGAVYLVQGPVTTSPNISGNELSLGASDVVKFTGVTASENIGAASNPPGKTIGSPGDVDGDGFSEILVGSWGNFNGAGDGAVYVVMGASSLSSGTLADADYILAGAGSEQAGISVGTAGDQDGDGLPELAIGANLNGVTATDAGIVYVISGGSLASDVLSNLALSTVSGDFNMQLGTASATGDANGDGQSDLAVSSWNANASGGIMLLYNGPLSGSLTASDADVRLNGNVPGAQFGSALGFGGDLGGTASGQDALLVSQPQSGTESVHLFLQVE